MRHFISVIYYIAFSYEIAITILYWSILFEGHEDGLSAYIDLTVHGLPLAALFLDFIFNPFSFDIKHFLLVLIAATIFVLINMAYSLGVQPVYGMVDWVTGESYGLIIAVYALLLLSFGIGILFFKCLKEKKLKEMFEEKKDSFEERDLAYMEKMKQSMSAVVDGG